MRGALVHDPSVILVRRIIPADAGSTNVGSLTDADLEDHPRGCGEHKVPARR